MDQLRIQATAHAKRLRAAARQLAQSPRLRGPLRDQPWRTHPAVRKGRELTPGERAADQLKRIFATWTALIVVIVVILWWLYAGGLPPGSDSPGFLHLNLGLSCFAALQCFILLIAARRSDQIAAEVALDTLHNTTEIKEKVEQTYALVLWLVAQHQAGSPPAQETETIPPCLSSPALQSARS